MTLRVQIQPALLDWAEKRSGIPSDRLSSKFGPLLDWKTGNKKPTLKQLELFAKMTHTPIGYLFLSEPPDEKLPIPDFRTKGNVELDKVSPDLLDTLYQCQQRQEWYRDYARLNREDTVPFIGSLSVDTNVTEAARQMRTILSFDFDNRGQSWSEAFRHLVDKAESKGVLVMVSGIVGSNTHRKLDPGEFQGFAITDNLAPLIFINGADYKTAQIFTLAHELAHLWLGESAVSNAEIVSSPSNKTEQWCNKVAAEFLVPSEELFDLNIDPTHLTDELNHLARRFKVSTLVCLRRLFDAGYLSRETFDAGYNAERNRISSLTEENRREGGSFYNTLPIRVSKRFTRALIESTLEGQTLYCDAFQMLGFKKVSTFNELASRLDVI